MKVFMNKFVLFYFIAFSVISINVQALTLGEMLNPVEEYLDCEQANEVQQLVCKEAKTHINSLLKDNSMSIKNGDLVYTLDPIVKESVDIVDSCEYGLRLEKGGAFKVKVASESDFNIQFDSISKPVLFIAKIPIQTNLEIKFYETTGKGIGYIFGSTCIGLARNYFSGSAQANLNSTLSLLISLEPKISLTEDDSTRVTINTIVRVSVDLSELNFSGLDIEGRDGLFDLLAGTVNILNTPFELVNDIYSNGISPVYNWDFSNTVESYAVGLGKLLLVEDAMFEATFGYRPSDALITILQEYAQLEAQRKLNKISYKLEESINKQLRKALYGETENWLPCSLENETCEFNGVRTVRYGSGSTWIDKTFSNGIECSNHVFGDPLPGVGKKCQILDSEIHITIPNENLNNETGLSMNDAFNFESLVPVIVILL